MTKKQLTKKISNEIIQLLQAKDFTGYLYCSIDKNIDEDSLSVNLFAWGDVIITPTETGCTVEICDMEKLRNTANKLFNQLFLRMTDDEIKTFTDLKNAIAFYDDNAEKLTADYITLKMEEK